MKLTKQQKDRIKGGMVTCDYLIQELTKLRDSAEFRSTASIVDVCIDEVKETKRSLQDMRC